MFDVDFKAYPKVELHLHLDCSLTFDVACRMQPSLTSVEYESNFIAPPKCLDLADYIARAERGIALMQIEENLRLVVVDLFEQLARDNVIYAEIRFAPLLHTRKGLLPEQVVEIVDDAVEGCCRTTAIEARIILCTLRHFTVEQGMETVQLVERFRGRRVAALDIAGDEAGFSIGAHVPAFHHAIVNNIPRTAHAGEAKGAESIWETLHSLQPSRIGHGVRCVDDASLVEHLKQTRTHLEVCPTSNVQTNVVDAHRHHQVDRLFVSGVSVGINTDARTISNVTLGSEYEMLHKTFGWGAEHFRQCNLNALEASFVPDTLKEKLKSQLLEECARYS